MKSKQKQPLLKGGGIKKRKKKNSGKKNIHVNHRQLAGLSPMEPIELYRSQIASSK